MTATLYRTDGTTETVTPATPPFFTLEEMQGFVGGFVEAHRINDGADWLLMNEDGYADDLPTNDTATIQFPYFSTGPRGIVGDVLVCSDGMLEE